MRKKALLASLALTMACAFTACSNKNIVENSALNEAIPTETAPAETKPVEENFAAEYEMKGTTSSGQPKNDTFIFEGKTTDGIITELNFDIIRNKGTEGEYSKKDIMGYSMNVSDAEIKKNGEQLQLTKLSASGYDTAYGEGNNAQYMVSAYMDTLLDTTTFKELEFTHAASFTEEEQLEKALIAFKGLAAEAGIEELTGDTLVKDLLGLHGLVKDASFVEGQNRVSFAGFHGGRSYGEQMDAIVTHILNNNMTLEDVYEMFKTENQASVPIEERDAITGATISFVGDFQRMVYVAMNGELFEGVTTHTVADDATVVEVVTQGYAGEIETHVTFDAAGNITDIKVRDANETDTVGGLLTEENSDFIKAMVAGQSDLASVDTVSGATATSASLLKAVTFAVDYYKGLEL